LSFLCAIIIQYEKKKKKKEKKKTKKRNWVKFKTCYGLVKALDIIHTH
jgi:hypothetical protein